MVHIHIVASQYSQLRVGLGLGAGPSGRSPWRVAEGIMSKASTSNRVLVTLVRGGPLRQEPPEGRRRHTIENQYFQLRDGLSWQRGHGED